MKLALAIVFASSLLTACAGSGSPSAGSNTLTLSHGAKKELETKGQIVASATSDKSKDDEVSCRQEEILGSHRKRVVCMTRAERAAAAEAAQDAVRNMQGATAAGPKD